MVDLLRYMPWLTYHAIPNHGICHGELTMVDDGITPGHRLQNHPSHSHANFMDDEPKGYATGIHGVLHG